MIALLPMLENTDPEKGPIGCMIPSVLQHVLRKLNQMTLLQGERLPVFALIVPK